MAFELGITAMGGIAIQIPGRLDERESIEDVTAYLNNWFDAIVARTKPHQHMLRLASAARIPVINARTDFNHPCEILGDLAFIRSRIGRLEGIKVAFVREATNLCHPWFEAAARLPIRVVQQLFMPYQITPEKLAWAAPEVLFLPCPPVHRGEEVSEAVMRSSAGCVYEAKEYLLHAQNAILVSLLSERPNDD